MLTETARAAPGLSPRRRGRQLDQYPERAARYRYLALVVVITVALYYALYVGGGVAPLMMREYAMPFGTLMKVLAFANLAGAFASLLAGLCDRFGRANLVVWGLLIVGLLVTFAIPQARTPFQWSVATCIVGFVEGIILVATPALIRDFSPQVGRATAMGFWTIGPVLGSLLVSFVATETIPFLQTWRSQYEICGGFVLVVFVASFFFLRELPPAIRDQIMVSERDRKLIERKAANVDHEAALRSPFRQMLRLDIIGSALAVSLLLLFYYSAVAFGVLFTVIMFGFTVERANSLANWSWAGNAFALIAFGYLADRLHVRKPFMLVGAVGALVMTIIFIAQIGGHPTYATLAVITGLQAAFTGCAYATWMANFTETVEAHNPALTATGLAIWGWILRVVVTLSFLLLPAVVTTVTPLVQAPIWMAALQAAQDANRAPSADVIAHLMALRHAVEIAPTQWRTWFGICTAGIVVFLSMVFAMRGRWNPAAAIRDSREHDRLVDAELARLGTAK